ncbi:uncharacterized protein LOC107782417 [Nicotiana tabacum]|uniref:Uncharacterized protein LOC107782417 n=1 Tax=Nicotiana tabacum TaxID=4097 RepID=A0AC58SJN6_TOBAC
MENQKSLLSRPSIYNIQDHKRRKKHSVTKDKVEPSKNRKYSVESEERVPSLSDITNDMRIHHLQPSNNTNYSVESEERVPPLSDITNDMQNNIGYEDDEEYPDLKQMLDDNNVLAKTFRMVRDRFQKNVDSNVKLRLIGKRGTDGRRYNLPTIPEVVVLVVGDFEVSRSDRDIIIETQSGQLQRINELNAAYLGLQYPLLFPYGEDGYREDIPLSQGEESSRGRQCVSMREFFAYRIQER